MFLGGLSCVTMEVRGCEVNSNLLFHKQVACSVTTSVPDPPTDSPSSGVSVLDAVFLIRWRASRTSTNGLLRSRSHRVSNVPQVPHFPNESRLKLLYQERSASRRHDVMNKISSYITRQCKTMLMMMMMMIMLLMMMMMRISG